MSSSRQSSNNNNNNTNNHTHANQRHDRQATERVYVNLISDDFCLWKVMLVLEIIKDLLNDSQSINMVSRKFDI